MKINYKYCCVSMLVALTWSASSANAAIVVQYDAWDHADSEGNQWGYERIFVGGDGSPPFASFQATMFIANFGQDREKSWTIGGAHFYFPFMVLNPKLKPGDEVPLNYTWNKWSTGLGGASIDYQGCYGDEGMFKRWGQVGPNGLRMEIGTITLTVTPEHPSTEYQLIIDPWISVDLPNADEYTILIPKNGMDGGAGWVAQDEILWRQDYANEIARLSGVPEPATASLILSFLGLIGVLDRRRVH